MLSHHPALPPRRHRRHCTHQRGVSLLEVLVSIVVFSVGLLGMLGMQTITLRYEQGAWARNAVGVATADIAERVRTVTQPTAAASVAALFNSTSTYAAERARMESAGYLTPGADCMGNACTPAELAAYHLTEWRAGLADSLPQAAGFISPVGAGAAPLAFQVVVAWSDKDLTDASNNLAPATQCAAGDTGIAARSCCPAALLAPAGVRCAISQFTP